MVYTLTLTLWVVALIQAVHGTCTDATGCLCFPETVTCRGAVILPGTLSRDSWPLSEHPARFADLEGNAFTEGQLLSFMITFTQVEWVNVKQPLVPVSCKFLQVMGHLRSNLTIISDCNPSTDLPNNADTSDITYDSTHVSTDTSSDSFGTTSITTGTNTDPDNASAWSSAKDPFNSTDPSRVDEYNSDGGSVGGGWILAGLLLVVLVVLALCYGSKHHNLLRCVARHLPSGSGSDVRARAAATLRQLSMNCRSLKVIPGRARVRMTQTPGPVTGQTVSVTANPQAPSTLVPSAPMKTTTPEEDAKAAEENAGRNPSTPNSSDDQARARQVVVAGDKEPVLQKTPSTTQKQTHDPVHSKDEQVLPSAVYPKLPEKTPARLVAPKQPPPPPPTQENPYPLPAPLTDAHDDQPQQPKHHRQHQEPQDLEQCSQQQQQEEKTYETSQQVLQESVQDDHPPPPYSSVFSTLAEGLPYEQNQEAILCSHHRLLSPLMSTPARPLKRESLMMKRLQLEMAPSLSLERHERRQRVQHRRENEGSL